VGNALHGNILVVQNGKRHIASAQRESAVNFQPASEERRIRHVLLASIFADMRRARAECELQQGYQDMPTREEVSALDRSQS
jgi:hypothetical protein